MKTDENLEKARDSVRTELTHQNDCVIIEYGQRDGETNFNNKFERDKKCVPKWSHGIHQF
jgi:hypothetical protein